MKKVSIFAMAFLVSILLLGCGMNKETKETTGTNNNTTVDTADKEVDRSNEKPTENIENNKAVPGDNDTHLEIADEAVDRITKLENVESVTVIVTNHNAYVAAVLKDTTGGEGTDTLEMKIADEVKATDSNIENVYVSVNPDFAERMTEYGTKIKAGEPVEGFFDEFTEAVSRVFPDAK